MRYAKDMNGKHCPWIKRYQVSATVDRLGIPIVTGASGTAGVANGTTTNCNNMVGIANSTVTYVTAQQAAGTKAERLVEVIVNPFAVLEMLLNGGAAASTQLTLYDASSTSGDGLTVTTGDAWNNPTYLNGVVWAYDGANAGQSRRATAVSATAATVTVAFENDIAVGDNFLRAPYWPGHSTTIQLTTNLDHADASIAVGDGAAFRCVELFLYDINGLKGRRESKVLAIPTSHIFNSL